MLHRGKHVHYVHSLHPPDRKEHMPKQHTEETRRKISASMKRHHADPRARRAKSRALIRYWARLEPGARSGENWRPGHERSLG